MNILAQFHADDERVLDRLVDGELTEGDRSELLAALDDEPGGWRRCALAFLESQAWREEFSRRAVASDERQPPHFDAAIAPSTRQTKLGGALAIAAGLLVAFTAGLWSGRSELGGRAIASVAVPGDDVADMPLVADDDAMAAPDVAETPWQTLTVTPADGDENSQPLQLRIAGEHSTEGVMEAQRSALPLRLIDDLQRAGLQVSRHEQWVRVELSDGRRMILPVEEVSIVYPEVAQN